MTATEDMTRLTERIIAVALADLRRRADEQETASRLYRVCEDAVAARHAALTRQRNV